MKFAVTRMISEWLEVEADSLEEAQDIANSTELGWWMREVEDESFVEIVEETRPALHVA